MCITVVSDDFVAITDDVGRAESFRATPSITAIRICFTGLVAIEEMGADITCTASCVALEIIVAGIVSYLLTMEALRRMYTGIVGAAVRR